MQAWRIQQLAKFQIGKGRPKSDLFRPRSRCRRRLCLRRCGVAHRGGGGRASFAAGLPLREEVRARSLRIVGGDRSSSPSTGTGTIRPSSVVVVVEHTRCRDDTVRMGSGYAARREWRSRVDEACRALRSRTRTRRDSADFWRARGPAHQSRVVDRADSGRELGGVAVDDGRAEPL